MKITTPTGIAHYPYISKPDEGHQYSDGKFKVDLSIPEEQAEPLIKQIKEFLVEGMKAEKAKGKKQLKQAPLPFKKEIDKETGEPTGNIIFKFKSQYKPHVFDAKKKLMVDHNIWGGSELKVNGLLYYYSSPAIGSGISMRLKAVQVIQYVQGTSDGADSFDFEEEEGFVFTESEDAESSSTEEQVDVSVNVDAAPAAEEKQKAKPKAKPAPVEEPEDVPVVSSDDDLASEIAKLVGE